MGECNCHSKKLGGHPRFYELLNELATLHDNKNRDYSEPNTALGNLLASERIGLSPFTGVMVRMQDKFCRLENLTKKKGEAAVVDEKITDTLRDLSVYSLLAIILWEEGRR